MQIIKEISIVWTDEDVKQQALEHNIILTEEEISDILSMMENNHDATIGINWDVIDYYIQEVVSDRKE